MSSGGSSIAGSAGVLAASAITHVLALYAMPAAPATRSTSDAPITMAMMVEVEVEPLPPPVTPPAPVDVRPPPRPTATPPPERTPEPVSPPAPTPTSAESAASTSQPRVEPSTTPPQTLGRTVVDPRAVARAALVLDGPRMPRVQEQEGPELDPEARDRALSVALSGELGAAANARPEGFGRRVLPEPVRRPDGTLAYTLGAGLTAVVNPDGSFTFGDVGNVSFGGMGNAEREGVQVGWGLEEWMMRRHGDDPHASERRWFASQTESMRDAMADGYVERQAAASARGMRGRATRIMGDASLAPDERRRRIFALWDGCAEGERVGDAARDALVAFVRDRMPQGSEDAYPETELDDLNRDRESTSEFRPYAP